MMITNVLKHEFVIIEPFGKLEIQELSAKAQMEISEAYQKEEQFKATFIACQYGVIDWRGATIDDIANAMPLSAVQEVASHVLRLSGYNEDIEKNSVSALSVVSS